MSSLWTPSGEHEPSEPAPPAGGPEVAPAPGSAPPSAEELDAIRAMHAQLRATPVADVVANHAAGLFQLAALHLGLVTPPDERGAVAAPDLAAAGVAIDALAALVDGLGPRLGPHEGELREALAGIQRAYADVSDALDGDQPPDPGGA